MFGDERSQNEVTGMVIIVGTAVILSLFFGFVAFQNFTTPGDDVPAIVFDFDYDTDDQQLTIRHEGGQTVDRAEVYVVVRSEPGDVVETSRWGETGTIAASDSRTIDDVPPASTATIIWDPSSGEQTYVIGEWSE